MMRNTKVIIAPVVSCAGPCTEDGAQEKGRGAVQSRVKDEGEEEERKRKLEECSCRGKLKAKRRIEEHLAGGAGSQEDEEARHQELAQHLRVFSDRRVRERNWLTEVSFKRLASPHILS